MALSDKDEEEGGVIMRRNILRFVCLAILTLLPITYNPLAPKEASAETTVMDVAKDLACPCECPLILADCNMTCGLEWKDEIGRLISEGKTKGEIINYFIAKYGEEARLTLLQKVHGKFYQYTRGFDTKDWVVLWTGGGIWVAIMFMGVYIGIKRFLLRKKA